MKWQKKGLIYAPSKRFEWSQSHSQVPTVDCVSEKIWRIYYSTRDDQNKSNTSYIEVEAGNPSNILYEHDEKILPLGAPGTFDDCGIMPSWVVNHGGIKYLFYIGWTTRCSVPYHNSIGLALSRDGGRTFEKAGEGPLFGPTLNEPFFTGTSCVLIEGDLWRIWYLSATKWEKIEDKYEPFYHLKYAESNDGLNWRRDGIVAIDYKDADEGAIANASVLKCGGIYHMWYSYRKALGYRSKRSATYRTGYACSADGKCWNRCDDKAGIDLSETGWDSEMIAYPHVVAHQGKLFMFYNGNGFGALGFGYAITDKKHLDLGS
jgi:hypothetical protein